jgi:hypothetical protein
VHASTDESASWAHDERPPSRRSRRCHHGTPVHARTGKGALQAHDVRSPPDYILFQMDQAGSLRPADEDDRERVRGRRGSPSERENQETSITIQFSRQGMAVRPARSLKARSSLVRRLAQAQDDPAKQRIRAWLREIDDEQLSSSLGLTPEDIAILRSTD